ncbi:MAG TPA: carboxylesterase family protein [Sphingomonas sp.]|uniref:carboxylesterase/lipase family protein n=1 Tax=Sphingomonas sp. TaxID=28214 RepID=UPI002ED8097B
MRIDDPQTGNQDGVVSRRALIGSAVVGTLLLSPGRTDAGAARNAAGVSGGGVATPDAAIVATNAGRIRGFTRHGIFTFRGIPYGGPTDGARRFAPATPPTAWSDVRSCLSKGPQCPQPARNWSNDEMAFIADWEDRYPSEDCLTVNVWTPSVEAHGKLPVMVWLHGGGFVTGSAYEQPAYDGNRLARRGAVVVSVTHRLGAFGFMDLSHLDDAALATSGNAGMLDIVLALQWVRDNIAAFGGDADRVTVFGQSGGGSKVSTLMAMPAARGLFHRAIVMSGSFPTARSRIDARQATDAVMQRLGVSDVAGLRAVPAGALVAAAEAVQKAAAAASPAGARGPIAGSRVWAPVGDGTVVAAEPWVNGAPAVSHDIPLMVGTVRDEFRLSSIVVDQPQLEARVASLYGTRAPAMLEALRQDFPGLGPNDHNGVVSGIGWRVAALRQLDLKRQQGGAAAYGYWFMHPSPLLDGRIGVPHCADIAYAFDNTEKCDQLTANDAAAQRLAGIMADAFVSFASTGRPVVEGRAWPAHAPGNPTVVFDRTGVVRSDPARHVFAVARA